MTFMRSILAFAMWFLLALPGRADTELLMFEAAWCGFCDQWDAEIGEGYPQSEEGRRAPLRRTDIEDPAPEDVTLDRPARLTPTFVLLHDGREVGRIEGYPGEEWFYPALQELLAKLPPEG